MTTQQQDREERLLAEQRPEYYTRFGVTDEHIALLTSIHETWQYRGNLQVHIRQATRIQEEMVVVFQILLHNGKIAPGDYERETWIDKWQRCHNQGSEKE